MSAAVHRLATVHVLNADEPPMTAFLTKNGPARPETQRNWTPSSDSGIGEHRACARFESPRRVRWLVVRAKRAADYSRKATWYPFGFARMCHLPLVADVLRVNGEFGKSAGASGVQFRNAPRPGVTSKVREADPMGWTTTPRFEDPPTVSGLKVCFLFGFARPSTHVAVPTMVAVQRGGVSGVS
jgi:hypothetical protein